jgi:NADH-quinone oxidoreductase subunit M
MILTILLIILLSGGLLAWLSSRWSSLWPRWISLVAVGIDLILVSILWQQHPGHVTSVAGGDWFLEVNRDWIPLFGIRFHLAIDGLSLLMVLLTTFLGFVSVLVSWTEIKERVGFFHLNLLWILAGIIGVFLALDLFLFYFFWEMMLIPMYFLISIWGHENRIYAAIKFFIFTQASGLLMLLAILGLYFFHGKSTGVYTYDYQQLLGTNLPPSAAILLMSGFLIAFLVKLPVVPLHNWLPDAHTEAPTAGSVILAGLLLKTGAYGLLRFILPLFPEAAKTFAPVAMILAVVGILYGAVLAFAQTDLKRLVAYTSVSHMGFVLLGAFSGNELALQGVVMQMICHGISTGALFILVGALQERIHTRDITSLGGLWAKVPRMAGVALLFAMASLGLPGLGNFVAEILILLGAYRANVPMTVLATVGLVAATIYSLWMFQRAFHGPERKTWTLPDLGKREMLVFGALILTIVWLGLYPQPILNTARRVTQKLSTAESRTHTTLLDDALQSSETRSTKGGEPQR